MTAQILLLALAGLMLAAAWTDATRFLIPNWISGALIVLWIPAAFALGYGWTGAGLALLTGFAVLAAGLALWAPGWLGGGDVKLLAAGALWFGWPDAVAFLVWSMLAGGVLAVALVLARRIAPTIPQMAGRLTGTALAPGAPAPYGIAIAAGALIALPRSQIFMALGL
ncbi:A24 family peptidase [Alkalicaulis satelles]|nr:prepilin peptidase [Alkalicaulis satelles]